ncbi:MAG: hypothetical protein AAF579_06045 [Cyanobacteria bacterium P01_C01_bin.118]
MGDSQGNPFISNPFMQGSKKKPPVSSEPEKPAKSPKDLAFTSSEKLSEPTPVAPTPTAKPSKLKKKSKPPSKAAITKSRPSTKRKTASPTPSSTPSYGGNGYKVQVLAKIPMPASTNMPSRDYLWFAVYPIIPRVGDCIFHDGRYFRVDAVFLYENTNASWCADLEVSYYTRRQ